MSNDRITVAIILKPQGIRGEVKVKAMTDTAEDMKAFKTVHIDGVDYSVLSVRAQGEFAYLSLKGIADRNSAELLRGKEIEVERTDMPDLPDGRYYIADLIGCTVVNERGDILGEVTEVTPAKTDIFTLIKDGKSIMFPAADGVISEVDEQHKKITVNGKRFKEVSL
ncbi:MAG: ribosome maturation factor RimM [Clostridia bacterium]|nr:ribosome maturation factor RimM [Clostridia bacterium]